ncbi:MAG: IclR family transcriptional regulator [Trebonia sp.]
MKNKPPYAIDSVDNALRILQTLRDAGQVRVSEAAAELGIARSTAHRLLSMLVYRDFAVKTDDHAYLPGPALSAPPLRGEPAQRLRRMLRPHMEDLRDRVGETVNLTVRLGAQTRFLDTVECAKLLRVGDRQGTILPAWQTSGGKVLLAELPDAQLTAILRGAAGRGPNRLTVAERRALVSELRAVRERGYAENIEESESGVCAVGLCVRDGSGEAVAALSVSAPSVRYTPERAQVFIRELRAAISSISLLTTVVTPHHPAPLSSWGKQEDTVAKRADATG